ncbi:MAG: ABC transporter substrate-binding protein [Alphaproteobacteria bacterium]|nr:ABC transporter substrate-binding protein [Alphaproteobacteria bacterium]
MPITLQENLRGILYTPFYAALALGAYRGEGVEVGFVRAPEPARAVEGLFAGTVDVAWGGPMRVMQTYDSRSDCDLVCFGEAVTRDPFFLMGREPRPDFTFADLYGRRIATVSEVPTPWLCLQEDLRRAGLDPEALPRVGDRKMAENVAALRRGELDVVQLFQPFAEELIAAGEGHVWYAAATRGPTSYTSFYTRRTTLTARREELKKVVRGLYRTQKWLHGSPPGAIAEVIQPFFPAVPASLLQAAIARYLELGIWGRNPILPRAGYERLRAGLISARFVNQAASFEQAVDNSIAEKVVREDPSALAW